MILYRRLETWPQRDTVDRKSRYQFRTSYPDILKQIKDELWRIDATDVMLEGLIPANKTRRDGWPLADAAPYHPGLRLSWQSLTVGPGELMTDEYETWQANLRAIGLTLEALRAVGRYGTMTRKQQYKGLLSAPTAAPPTRPGNVQEIRNVQEAAKQLARMAGVPSEMAEEILTESETLAYYFRVAAKLVHPDPNGGDDTQFRQLLTLKELLDTHHKSKTIDKSRTLDKSRPLERR